MGSKLIAPDPEYYPNADYAFWCPGCNSMHEVAVTKKNNSNASWSFDGNLQRPTFSPSLHIKVNTPDMGKYYQPDVHSFVCHSFVRDGQIQFLGDCTHSLRGQIVDLPDFPDGKQITGKRL